MQSKTASECSAYYHKSVVYLIFIEMVKYSEEKHHERVCGDQKSD